MLIRSVRACGLALALLLAVPAAGAALEAQPAAYVRGIATSQFDPSSSDPAGIAYDAGRDEFIISDSEVEEVPTVFDGFNLFTLARGASVAQGTGATQTFPLPGFEPTGLGIDPADRTLYVSDDDRNRVYVVRPGVDGLHGTADDAVTFFRIDRFGDLDAEGVEFDAATGHLLLCDGSGIEVYEIDPVNGVFGDADDAWMSFDLERFGMRDCEGIGIDEGRGTLLAVEPFQRKAYELTRTGTLVRTIDLSTIPLPARTNAALSSLTLAPSSDPADDPAVLSFWVTDRQVDNGADPTENDGLLHEFAVPPPPTVRFPNAGVAAGEGAGVASVTVVRPTGGLAGSVRVRTVAGTAKAGEDFTPVDQVVDFGVGQASATVAIPLTSDALDEDDEQLTLRLSDPQGDLAVGTPAETTLTIVDDDEPPTVDVGDASVDEGDGNGAELVFPLRLSAPSGRAVRVTVQTEAGTAQTSDFATVMRDVEIPAGETAAQVAVRVVGDRRPEGDERLAVRLSAPVNAVLGVAEATGTIIDGDPPGPLRLAAAAVTVDEGAGQARLTLERPRGGRPGSVRLTTTDGTASAGADYTPPAETVTFAEDQTVATVVVPVAADGLDELDETFEAALSDPTDEAVVEAPSRALVTITDDDPPPGLSVAAAAAAEGPGARLAFAVSLSAPSARAVGFTLEVTPGTAGTDDVGPVPGPVTVPAGATGAVVEVPVVDDAVVEDTETLTVRLVAPVDATVAAGTATGTITDNDAAPDPAPDPTTSPEPSPDPEPATGDPEAVLAGLRPHARPDGTVRLGRLERAAAVRRIVVCADRPRVRRGCAFGRTVRRVAAGSSARPVLRLRPAARRLLRRRGSLRVRVTVTVRSADGARRATAVVRLRRSGARRGRA